MYTESFAVKSDSSQTITIIDDALENDASKLQLLTPPLSCEDSSIPVGTIIPPHLPKMFLDLLVPVEGLKRKKMSYHCTLCGDGFVTWNSLVTHNKSHRHPACLTCGQVVPSLSKLTVHTALCQGGSNDPVVVTSKYGRSRPVRSYIAALK